MAEAVRGRSKTVILDSWGWSRTARPSGCRPPSSCSAGASSAGSLFGGIKPKTDLPVLARKCMAWTGTCTCDVMLTATAACLSRKERRSSLRLWLE